jgi:branched-chain amino acid transport system permease protein
MTLIFVTALLAMSLNMVVGHGGLFQFHHGVFYGVGAYAFALTLVKAKLPVWFCFAVSPIVQCLGLTGWLCPFDNFILNAAISLGFSSGRSPSLVWSTGRTMESRIAVLAFLSSTTSLLLASLFVLCLIVMYLIFRLHSERRFGHPRHPEGVLP